MITSIFLARLLSPLLLLAGIGIAVNRDDYRSSITDFLASGGLLYLSGALLLLGGTAIVLTHNVWSADWRIIITLIGWLTALRGAALIVAPRWTTALARRWVARPQLMIVNAVIVIVLGVVLGAIGYSQ